MTRIKIWTNDLLINSTRTIGSSIEVMLRRKKQKNLKEGFNGCTFGYF